MEPYCSVCLRLRFLGCRAWIRVDSGGEYTEKVTSGHLHWPVQSPWCWRSSVGLACVWSSVLYGDADSLALFRCLDRSRTAEGLDCMSLLPSNKGLAADARCPAQSFRTQGLVGHMRCQKPRGHNWFSGVGDCSKSRAYRSYTPWYWFAPTMSAP